MLEVPSYGDKFQNDLAILNYTVFTEYLLYKE